VITTAAHYAGLRSVPAGWAPCMTSENRGEDAAEPGDQYEGGSSAKALRLPEERGARIQTDQAKAKARKDLGKKTNYREPTYIGSCALGRGGAPRRSLAVEMRSVECECENDPSRWRLSTTPLAAYEL